MLEWVSWTVSLASFTSILMKPSSCARAGRIRFTTSSFSKPPAPGTRARKISARVSPSEGDLSLRAPPLRAGEARLAVLLAGARRTLPAWRAGALDAAVGQALDIGLAGRPRRLAARSEERR